MIRKYYILEEMGGGEYINPTAPEGYQVSTPEKRAQWNGFLDHLSKRNVNLDANPKVGMDLLNKYKKSNPGFSITAADIPSIQYEQHQIRKGDSFGDLKPAQLNYIRQGLPESYLNKSVDTNGMLTNNTAKLYYPQKTQGDNPFGHDIEGYVRSKGGLAPVNTEAIDPAKAAGPAPTTVAAPINAEPIKDPRAGLIPRPDYNSAASRGNFLKTWTAKYGNLEGRGDTVLKVDDVPRGGSDTIKNISVKAASKYGIDPALLYTSAMEEGASGLFKDRGTGIDTKHRKPGEFGYQDDYGDKDYPINGGQSFGFNTFSERFPELVKGGYLPKEFEKNFRGKKNAGQFGENNFKSVEAAMQAKAALMKSNYDYVEKLAAKKGINLSQKAKDFFSLAAYNGGEGAVLKRLDKYKQAGLLEGDKFLKERPNMEKGLPSNLDVYGHVVPRMKMRDALKEQKRFDNEEEVRTNRISDEGLGEDNEGNQQVDKKQQEGPITFLNSYYQSPEFQKKSGADYDVNKVYYQKGAKAYQPEVVDSDKEGSHGVDARDIVNSRRFDEKGATTVTLDKKQSKELGYDMYNEVLPHEYTHTTRNLSPADEAKFVSKNKFGVAKSFYERYKKDNGGLGSGKSFSDWMRGVGSHEELPSENYADLNALRWNLEKNNIYDARKGPMNVDHIKKAMADPRVKDKELFKRLLRSFSPEDIVELNNTVAKNDSNKEETA